MSVVEIIIADKILFVTYSALSMTYLLSTKITSIKTTFYIDRHCIYNDYHNLLVTTVFSKNTENNPKIKLISIT